MPSSQTNATGQVTGTVSIGQDRSNRTVTVTATSGTLVRTAAFLVTGARFSQASPVPAVVLAAGSGVVQYTLADVNSNPMATAAGRTRLLGGEIDQARCGVGAMTDDDAPEPGRAPALETRYGFERVMTGELSPGDTRSACNVARRPGPALRIAPVRAAALI